MGQLWPGGAIMATSKNFYLILRIANSRRGRIYSLWNISITTKATTSCDISNERADFSACVDISGF